MAGSPSKIAVDCFETCTIHFDETRILASNTLDLASYEARTAELTNGPRELEMPFQTSINLCRTFEIRNMGVQPLGLSGSSLDHRSHEESISVEALNI